MDKRLSLLDRCTTLGGGGVVLAGLLAANRYNYLLFHCLAEVFFVVVLGGIFVLAWNSRRIIDNNYLLFIGLACPFIAAVHLLHMLAYKGMGVFAGGDADVATKLWIAARYLGAGSFVLAPLAMGRRPRVPLVLAGYAAVTTLLVAAVFGGIFPACFVGGQGLTPFKKLSEYLISLLFLVSLVPLHRKRNSFDPHVFRLIVGAVVADCVSELPFAVYSSVFDYLNATGHLLMILSAYLLYRAIIVTGLRRPHDLLFRDLKLSEQRALESEARYRALFNQMSEGFALHEIVCDESGTPCDYRFLDVNPAFERFTGLRGSDVVGKTLLDVMPASERGWIDRFGRVALTGEPAHFEDYAAVLGKYYEVFAYRPAERQFAVLFVDVTERHRAGEALRQTADELARSNRELEEFTSVVSHDLKAPLRTVTGYLQLLDRRYKPKLDAEAGEFIQFAVDGAARMRQLIDDLLAYARVTTRGRPPEPADCGQLLDQALLDLQSPLRESGATIVRDPLPTVQADKTQLGQLFQNLIGNAIKFRRDEAPTVHVSARPANRAWQFSVRDNGIGIEPQHIDRVFEMFERLHGDDEYPGTGIGLAICKKIVERHGGRIWVESEPGKGSTFHFTLAGAQEGQG